LCILLIPNNLVAQGSALMAKNSNNILKRPLAQVAVVEHVHQEAHHRAQSTL
jgi:dipeptidase